MAGNGRAMTIRTIGCLLFGTFAKATAPASDTGRPSPAEIAIVDVGQIRRRGVRADGARIPLVHGRDRGGEGLGAVGIEVPEGGRSEEHTSELQSLMRTSYAV